jgi:hypothetical protein
LKNRRSFNAGVGGTQGAKRAVPIYDVDYILGACREKVSLLQIGRDYEQKAFVESLLQDLYVELKTLIEI